MSGGFHAKCYRNMANIFSYFNRLSVPSADVKTIRDTQTSGERAIILDVRTPQEHDNSRIPESMLMPLDTIVRDIERVIPDKDATIYIHCNTGIRSSHATKILRDRGYRNAYNMTGGIFAWREAGYPVNEG